MANIIFTAGAKGGTGKSSILRFLVTYLRENDLDPTLLDMDDESRTLGRYFPEAERVEMKKVPSNDILIRKVVTEGKKLIVADLKAGTGRDTLLWWKDVQLED
jgi:cellulose biosynthesis protein BcsQ